MDFRYWVAPTESPFSSSNWSTIPGGPSGASVPSIFDVAVFNSSGSGSCLLNTNVNIRGIALDGYTGTMVQQAHPVNIGDAAFLSGSFSGSTYPINILGNTLLGGTDFTSTSSMLSVWGAFVNSDPSKFHDNSGTFKTFAHDQTFSPNGAEFFNLTFDTDETKQRYYTVETCYVKNELTLAGGYLKKGLSDGTIHALGDVACYPSFGKVSLNHNATIAMESFQHQDLVVEGGIFPNLCVNKAGTDQVKALGTSPIYVSNDFVIQDGTFFTNGHSIKIGYGTPVLSTLPIPELQSPITDSIDVALSPTLYWNATPDAESYTIQVCESPDFLDPVFSLNRITDTSQAIPELSPTTVYYWHVNASSADGTSLWSGIWRFISIQAFPPAVPVLYAPSSHSIGVSTDSTLEWLASSGATSYGLQVSTVPDFATTVFDQDGIPGTSQVVTGLSFDTPYYWHVDASNSLGSSAWSTTWDYTTIVAVPSVPTLLAPSNHSIDISTDSTLEWNAAAGAVSYGLQVSTVPDFASTVYNQTGILDTSRIVTGLSNNTPYYWHVDASNAGGSSAWSTTWDYTTVMAIPSVPTLYLPGNHSTGIPVDSTLEWYASSGADSYGLQVSTVSDFATTVYDQSNITDTSRVVTGLSNDSTYYWHVDASNVQGSSAWSTAWDFRTVAGPFPYPRTDIEFIDSGIISSPAGTFLTDGFQPGGLVFVSGSGSNDGSYTIESVTDTEITVTVPLVSEAAGLPVILATLSSNLVFGSVELGVDPMIPESGIYKSTNGIDYSMVTFASDVTGRPGTIHSLAFNGSVYVAGGNFIDQEYSDSHMPYFTSTDGTTFTEKFLKYIEIAFQGMGDSWPHNGSVECEVNGTFISQAWTGSISSTLTAFADKLVNEFPLLIESAEYVPAPTPAWVNIFKVHTFTTLEEYEEVIIPVLRIDKEGGYWYNVYPSYEDPIGFPWQSKSLVSSGGVFTTGYCSSIDGIMWIPTSASESIGPQIQGPTYYAAVGGGLFVTSILLLDEGTGLPSDFYIFSAVDPADSWTQRHHGILTGGDYRQVGLAYGNGLFAVVSQSYDEFGYIEPAGTAVIFKSLDGMSSWTQLTAFSPSGTIKSITLANDLYLIVVEKDTLGVITTEVHSSTDGETWSAHLISGTLMTSGSKISYSNNLYILTGTKETLIPDPEGDYTIKTGKVLVSIDLDNWTDIAFVAPPDFYTLEGLTLI